MPEFLFVRLVQEREVPHMVYEDVAQYWQVRIKRRYLSEIRAERSTEALKCGRRAKFVDFPGYLLGDELTL